MENNATEERARELRSFNQEEIKKPGNAIFTKFEQVKGNPLPPAIKEPRAATFSLAKVERDLFSDLEEKKRAESGEIIVKGLQISEFDFWPFVWAIGKALYNQSYQSGNEETHTGLQPTYIRGNPVPFGNIVVTLTDLCRDAYGTDNPDTAQKRKMKFLLEYFDTQRVEAYYSSSGDYDKKKLISIVDESGREKGKKITYNILVNPVFSQNAGQGFSGLPQDYTRRLNQATKRLTVQDYRLTNLLKVQDKRQTFIRRISQLLQDLDLEEAYKKNRKKTEDRIIALCETQIKTKMLTGFDPIYSTSRSGKKILDKIVFHLNKDLNKSDVGDEQPEQLTE